MNDQGNVNKEQENLGNSVEAEHMPVSEKTELQENIVLPQEMPSKAQVSPPAIPEDANSQPASAQAPVMPVSDNSLTQPVVSTDDDLDAEEGNIIEKPWVDAAENIIKKDEGNPYLEEEDHEDLQSKYLKKRFGKEIKKTEE